MAVGCANSCSAAILRRSFHPRRHDRLPEHDREKSKWRHLVENFFCQLKAFAASPRGTKRPKSFAATINIVATVLASNKYKQALVPPSGSCDSALREGTRVG